MPSPITNRADALDFLLERIDYERTAVTKGAARCFKLDRMRQLLEQLGNPQLQLPAVHIAGTKGKGSTAAMVAQMLSAGGYRTGLFTSPHIQDLEERMRVDGAQPDERELVELANRVSQVVHVMDRMSDEMRPTFFEIVTAIAWLYFMSQQADIVVLEVGLGGRLDATNLCAPLVTVITNISYDHTAVLGSTLAAIAGEKAGIVKPQVPVVSGVVTPEARSVIRAVCRERDAALIELDRDFTVRQCHADRGPASPVDNSQPRRGQGVDIVTPARRWSNVKMPLAGSHQAVNAALALTVIDLLDKQGYGMAEEAARRGLADVSWPLRIEVLMEQPTVIVDAAHNVASARALVETLNAEFPAERSLLIFAATRDKDYGGMLEELQARFETIVLTTYRNNPRGVPVQQVQAMLSERCGRTAHIPESPTAAWEFAASSTSHDLICITGSFFLAAEMRDIVLQHAATLHVANTPPVTE